MRRGDNNRKIGDIIKKLMKNPRLVEKLDKLDAIEIWQEIIGSQLHKYITSQNISDGILYIKLNSSVVRNELMYKKTQLLKQINQRLGKKFISDIILR
tara:strand:- start:2153 stop:2446 length:294 start_codon:yes stop_codon:yes gene_type:complete